MVRSIVATLALIIAAGRVVGAQDVQKGQQLYTDQKCAVCHAIAGKGNTKGPLDDVGVRRSAAEIRAWVTDAQAMTAKTKAARKPEMKQYTLPKEDVDALVAYLSTLKAKS